jgi:branched-chain amino acid transport system substrate-binding protein
MKTLKVNKDMKQKNIFYGSKNMNRRTIMRQRQILVSILMVLIFFNFVFIIGCKKDTAEEKVFKIGAILPLTGYLAYLGQEEKNALLLAQDEINSSEESIKIEILFEDSKSTAKDGITAYQKLRQNNLNGVITSLTIVSEAILPLTKKDKTIQFVLSVHPDIAKESQWAIRAYYGLEHEMKLMATYLASSGAKEVAALYINVPEDTAAINNYFKNYLKEEKIGLIGQETYDFSSKSVNNQLLKLKNLNPDFIMTIDFGYMYPTILKEAQNLGIRNKILGGLGMMTAPPIPADLTEGLIFASASFIFEKRPEYLNFLEKYESEYVNKPTFDGVYTYDVIKLLYKNLKNGKTNRDDFLNFTYNGISGKIYIDETGTGKVDISILKYDENGNIIKVK